MPNWNRYCIIPTIRHPRKDIAMEKVKRSVVAGVAWRDE